MFNMSENRSMQYAEILSKLIQVETISSREKQAKNLTRSSTDEKALACF